MTKLIQEKYGDFFPNIQNLNENEVLPKSSSCSSVL